MVGDQDPEGEPLAGEVGHSYGACGNGIADDLGTSGARDHAYIVGSGLAAIPCSALIVLAAVFRAARSAPIGSGYSVQAAS